MELPRLIEALTNPAAYPHPVDTVEVRQTHISVVFLAGAFAYKLKKPVSLGFLDFSTLEKRRHFCHEELTLNRRLADGTYLDVVPVVATPEGPRFGDSGEVIEWAVKMRRLPPDATLLAMLERGEASRELVQAVARRIAAFHRRSETNERITSHGRFESVARNFVDVLARIRPNAGISATVFQRIHDLVHADLARLRRLIESRADHGKNRHGHGDLHLDHVYVFPDREPPADLVIVDCIEFHEQFRCLDPVADMAFVVMDLTFRGRRDLARAFAETYFLAAEDDEGWALLPLYTAYRATIRGMVDSVLQSETEVPAAEREAVMERSRAYGLLALGELESPGRRPALVLVAGPPGTGKSTVSAALAGRAGFTVIRSDVVRKELAGVPPQEPTPPERTGSLYSQEATDRTYAECLARAGAVLAEGGRVIVDATFREEHRRLAFHDAARRFGVPFVMLCCEASPATIRPRLASRRDDPSDADWNTYQQHAATWQEPGPEIRRVLHTITTDGLPEAVSELALQALCQSDLAPEPGFQETSRDG